MVYKRCFFLSAVCLLLLGCAAPATESEYTPTPDSAVEVTESAVQPPTVTATAVPPMMITSTPTSTPVPTETPDLIVMTTPAITMPKTLSLPPSEGTIIFTQLSGVKPAPEEMGLRNNFSRSLYVAKPSSSPNTWLIELMLADVADSEPAFSPDQTKLAILSGPHEINIVNLETNDLTSIEVEGHMFDIGWINDTR